jgi:hypothetical protein
MKKNTWIILGVFVALLATYLVLEQAPEGDRSERLSLPTLSEPPKEEAKAEGEATPATPAVTGTPMSAINLVEIVRAGETVRIERAGEDEWTITQPRKARVDSYKVKQMLGLFKTASESIFSTPLKDPKDLRYYGLDDAERVKVTLHKDGQVWLSLRIGNVEKADDQTGDRDTFVQKGGDDWIFRIQGKDLRAPFDKPFADLRSKKLFGFKREQVKELRVANPDDARYPEIVLVRDAAAPAEEGTAAPKPEERWSMTKPAGFAIDKPTSYLSSFANLSVSGFEAEAPAGAGLDGPVYRITALLDDGQKHGLLLGQEVGDAAWARVEGSDEVVKVSKYTAKSLRKGAMDFRNKKLLSLSKEEVTRVQYGDLVIARAGEAWRMSGAASHEAGADEMDKALRDLTSFAIDGYVSPDPGPQATGLDASAARLVVQTANARYEVLLGKEEDGKRYGTLAGSGEIWRATTYNTNKLVKQAAELRRHRVFDFELGQIKEITLTHEDETLTLVTADEAYRGKATNAKFMLASPASDKPLDQLKLDGVATSLVALKAKDFLAPADAAPFKLDAPAFTATVELSDGKKRQIALAKDKKDSDFVARSDARGWSGQAFTLQPFQANKLRKRLHELHK